MWLADFVGEVCSTAWFSLRLSQHGLPITGRHVGRRGASHCAGLLLVPQPPSPPRHRGAREHPADDREESHDCAFPESTRLGKYPHARHVLSVTETRTRAAPENQACRKRAVSPQALRSLPKTGPNLRNAQIIPSLNRTNPAPAPVSLRSASSPIKADRSDQLPFPDLKPHPDRHPAPPPPITT